MCRIVISGAVRKLCWTRFDRAALRLRQAAHAIGKPLCPASISLEEESRKEACGKRLSVRRTKKAI
jgi:hypothetical protein